MGYHTRVTLVVEAPREAMLSWMSTIALTEKLAYTKEFFLEYSTVAKDEHTDEDRLRMLIEYDGKFYKDFDWVQRIHELLDDFAAQDVPNIGARMIMIGEEYADIDVCSYGDWSIDMWPETYVQFDFQRPSRDDDVRKAQDPA